MQEDEEEESFEMPGHLRITPGKRYLLQVDGQALKEASKMVAASLKEQWWM